uniref:Helicase ATP-binding domain-containing protein n=1 Tax=viral metagenome TaxID=1070528 RepID=A0A6C0CYT9_9ZZZZ
MLTDFQQDILNECLKKGSGGLSLKMGTGKTVLALYLAQQQRPDLPSLVVVSKTLLSSWENEIKKFFGDSFPYVILHKEKFATKQGRNEMKNWVLPPFYSKPFLVLTTPQVLGQVYRDLEIERHFVMQVPNEYIGFTNVYHPPDHPLLSPLRVEKGPGLLYTTRWGCLIVDEAHGYCNILTDKCRSIASLCREHVWLLSGTLFSEPKTPNILGYYSLLHDTSTPRDMISMESFLRYASNFRGLQTTIVHRETTGREKPSYQLHHEYVYVKMSKEEIMVYEQIQKVLKKLHTFLRRSETTERRRRFASYILAVITYLRQIFVAPIIVFASIALDVCKLKERSELSILLRDEFMKVGLMDWLEHREALYSSRLLSVVEKLKECTSRQIPRIIIFSAFRTSLKLLEACIHEMEDSNWECMTLESHQSTSMKEKILERFKHSSHGILLLTYKTGSEGLNLQHCNTVFLLDLLWNMSSRQQAIARVARQGQLSSDVNVVTFMSNTGIEKAMLEKQKNKKEIAEELMEGTTTKHYQHMKVEDIVKMVLKEDTNELYQQLLCS